MNLTVSLIVLRLFFDKIFGTLAEKLLTFHHWPSGSNVIFGILAIFYYAMQNDKLKVTSAFI
jgi:hypothetical protein